MTLTENQCEKLHEAILDLYPYEQKDALESFLSEKCNINLEYILAYSDIITKDKLSNNIHRNNNQQINETIQILILKIPAKDLNLDKEIYELKKAIRESNNRDLLSIRDETVYSTDDIRDYIRNENPQIVHFCGHGLPDGSLKLENNSSSGISLEFLKSIFQGRENNIKCVLLNACHSEQATLAISQYIDYVVGMNKEIIDQVAIEFAKGFYGGLGCQNDNDIYLMAFNEGIRAIIAKNIFQKSVPVLRTRISYEEAIFNLLQKLDTENKINDFIDKIRPYPYFSNSYLFKKFYCDFSYTIKQANLDNLVVIANKIKNNNQNNWNLVQSAYRETLPNNATVDNSKLNNPQNINNIIDILRENYPFVRGNVPSILEFSKNLAGKFAEGSEEYPKIKSWVEEVSSRLDISIDVKPKVESSLTTNPKTCLLIIISPEEANFRLKAEYILDENQKSPPQPFDFQKQANTGYETDNGVICSEKEIPLVVEKIINSFMSRFKEKILKPIIEIFLPYKYLGKNLDHEWRIEDDHKIKIAIVQEYNIIFYPLERCTGTNSYFNFKESWLKFKTFLESDAETQSIVARLEIIQTVGKDYRILGKRLKEKIGVKLMSPFPVKEQEQEYFWRAVLSGGTPLAFWTRYHPQKQMNLDDIDSYLAKEYLENDFANFINEMCNLRQDAYNDEENQEDKLGYHLGFLCDNLNRIQRSELLKSFL